jgi:CRISPR-associated endonuclease/helicase Cas3
VFPGLVLLLDAAQGGYDPELGWTGKTKTTDPLPASGAESDANDRDPHARSDRWETLRGHSDRVCAGLAAILAGLPWVGPREREALFSAGRRHDWGKAHLLFQGALPPGAPAGEIWAKPAGTMRRYARKGFRHELASALAMLDSGQSDLAAYLAAAHHGKVRLSIRSMPHESPPREDPERLFARGLLDGDELPAVDLGGGVKAPAVRLRLAYMELGEDEKTGPSWLARMLALRDDPGLGPFRLAFLEALLRAADMRASRSSAARSVFSVGAVHEEKAAYDPALLESGRAWLSTWEKAGAELERIGAAELAAMTDEEARRAMRHVFEMWQPSPEPPGENGLVVQQRLFAGFHALWKRREGEK